MESWHNLMMGFGVALKPGYFLICLGGAVMGTLTGILPGFGPLAAMAILLSLTLKLDATGAMILFAGIYYGAMYGGSTTSILLNIPGEAASVVTCIDGYKMAQKGRGGAALAVAAVGSFVAGNVSIVGLMFVSTSLARVALKFGPPEFFAIGVCGLIILIRISHGSMLKCLIMVLLGLALSMVGMDTITGVNRFTFGVYDLGQGVDFLPVAMGLFGIAEVMSTTIKPEDRSYIHVRLREMFPTVEEWRRSIGPILRGSVLGFLIGLIPGPAPVISTFTSYLAEKRLSRRPEEFGQGAIEGVAGPEAANNASVGGAYVPLLGLGIPFSPHMAIVLGALMLQGITPGPNMIVEKPELFWGLMASMYLGNFVLLILNLPLIGVFLSVLRVPRGLLLPLIVVFCVVGVYSINSSYVDLMVLAAFGLLGYIFRRIGFEPAPLVLALVIGPMIETSLRQTLKMSGGDVSLFFTRAICMVLYLIVVAVFLAPGLYRKIIFKRRNKK